MTAPNWTPNPKTVRYIALFVLLCGSGYLLSATPAAPGLYRPVTDYTLVLPALREWTRLSNESNLNGLPPGRALVMEPEPGSDAFHILFNDRSARELIVNDHDGQRVDHTETTGAEYFLRTTDWPAGLYFLTVRERARRSVYRLYVPDRTTTASGR